MRTGEIVRMGGVDSSVGRDRCPTLANGERKVEEGRGRRELTFYITFLLEDAHLEIVRAGGVANEAGDDESPQAPPEVIAHAGSCSKSEPSVNELHEAWHAW